MVECGRHLNIELLTLSEVQEVQGEEGNFTVTVKKNPRYVDMDKCIACGMCAEKCPKKVTNLFNEGLNKRKAIYIPYGQSVPLKYAIDGENCLYLQKGKCGNCAKVCPTGAINYEDKEELIDLHVGSIIAAPGFKAFDPVAYDLFGYGTNKDVITSMQLERILSSSGPFMGHLQRPSDKAEPKKIAWLQCVGSRNTNQCDHGYCSSVCCMYAIKQAILSIEHASEGLECSIFYMDMRTHGKEFEKYYELAKQKGIQFVRNRIHTAYPQEGGGVLLEYMGDDGKLTREPFDMFVLSVGLETGPAALRLAETLGIELDVNKFAKTSCFEPVTTSRKGVYVCGAFEGPKDIPQAVVEASAAACAASSGLAGVRGALARKAEKIPAIDISGEPPRVGVFICSCGTNIAGVVDVDAVAEYAKGLPGVAYVTNNLFTCSQDTQDKMVEVIKEQRLNRIVVAACTPRTHEPLFQETMVAAGLNKYLFEMANIRNQVSWVHSKEPQAATEKSKDLVRMAVAKAVLLQPLNEPNLSVNPSTLVIGGGIAGMTAALELARQGFHACLVEQAEELGGNARYLRTTAQGDAIAPFLDKLIAQVENNPNIIVYKSANITSVDGFVGNFQTVVEINSSATTLQHGAVILATGAKESTPTEYEYGNHPAIKTLLELDQALTADQVAPKTAVFIQCVGSREPGRPYCSRLCCTHSVKSAILLKERDPKCRVVILYRDMRTYGNREDLYQKARQLGVVFIRFGLDNKPRVQMKGDKVEVTVEDHVLKRDLIFEADLLCLAAAITSHDNEELAKMFKVPLSSDGWLFEAHQKLRPVDFATDGVFMAGMAHYPKPLEETIAQAQAAVARAVTVLSKTEISTPGTVAVIDHTKCVGCSLCWQVCPYGAISPDENGLAVVNEILCKGCGTCVASCRSGAPNLRGFSKTEVLAQITALF